jgi:hypothetical protein
MSDWTAKLNGLSLGEFPDLCASLKAPKISDFAGNYRGTFVGPGWLRVSAGPALAVSGLGGWWGKHFEADGRAVNLVQRGGKLEARFPMQLVEVISTFDGQPGLALHYGEENPFPWPYIVDELRQLGEGAFLGMTYVNTRALRGLAFPFLLEFQEQIHGL